MSPDKSLRCEFCDTLGVAGPCRKHKEDPFAGVVDIDAPYYRCNTCGGDGFIPDEYVQNAERTCPVCNGSGDHQ